MEKIRLCIETLSPVVLTNMSNSTVMTETHDFFSGSILRGTLAARYIEKQQLGDKAHEDEGFRQCFFGSVRFVDAYPVYHEHRATILPLSLQKNKITGDLRNLLTDEPQPGDKSWKGFGVVYEGRIASVEVSENISLHMSRCSGNERLAGHSLDGKIYNYESVDAGQCFEGFLVGEKEVLERLVSSLMLDSGSMCCHIGRSKYTQYGFCKLTFQKAEPLPPLQVKKGPVFVHLDTPVLGVDGLTSRADQVLGEVAQRMNAATGSSDFSLGRIFSAPVEIDNFVGVWGMKRPRQTGIAAGSIFELKKNTVWTDDDGIILQDILHQGIGDRTNEGFGQLDIWPAAPLMFWPKNAEEKTAEKFKKDTYQIQSPAVKHLAGSIIMKRLQERMRMAAFKDTEGLGHRLLGMTHVFARLEDLLGERSDLDGAKERFHQNLREELRAGSKLEGHLHAIKLNGKELYNILLGESAMPYESIDIHQEIPQGLAEKIGFTIPTKTNGVLFYEYWLWFFRHARKQAVSSREGK